MASATYRRGVRCARGGIVAIEVDDALVDSGASPVIATSRKPKAYRGHDRC